MWSQQEELMVKGLSNRLQCEAREAIRIAVYEACKVDTEKLKPLLVFASATTKKQGHTSRDRKGSVALPKQEKEDFNKLIKILSITENVGLRLCVIWLEKGINNESITKITNCKLIAPLKIRQQWAKDNPEKASQPSTIQPLIDAQKAALNELEYIKYLERKRREAENKLVIQFQSDNPGHSYETSKVLLELESSEAFEKLIQEEAENQGLASNEIEVFRYMSLGLTKEEAEAAVSQEHDEPRTEEEEELLLAEIDEMTKSWESEPKAKPGEAVQLRKKQRNKAREFKPGEHKDLILKLEDEIENLEDRIEKGEEMLEHRLRANTRDLKKQLGEFAMKTYWDELYPDT